DRGLDGSMRGHHDHLHLGTLASSPAHQTDAVDLSRHSEVGDHQLERRRTQPTQCVEGVARLGDVMTVARERLSDQLADARLVVYHEDGRHQRLLRGSSTRNSAPPPTPFAATIRPPWSSAIRRATARPSPVPLVLVVKNGSKILSALPSGRPTPKS